ncbi:fatty acid desaturase [Flagellatimonas centrodinii]|uniref:fatty acid desaturase family protein n=1 Tax=Flagellatimonas centrodinii TaxID=2806210 RepID=UPI001FEDBCB0|nr:fatty acid desaturase [Flagellatimonas centrodinii]ULQ47888.1 fatty acid desaturase [Flagellatimonas centrodinii]
MQQDLSTLNRQAIDMAREYTGAVAWPTVLLTAAVIAGVVLTLGAFASGALSLWLAIPLYAALTYMSYTPLHEAAHGNIHGGQDRLQWLNDLCGYLVAPLIMVPYSTHKVEHFTHHRYTNQPEKDPDYVVSNMRHGFVSFLIYGFRFLWVQNTFLFRDYWATAPRRERLAYFAEVGFAIGWRVAFVVLVGQTSALVLLVAGYFVGAFFTAYWFAYRPHLPYDESARYRNTNSLFMPRWMKPLEWFWLGQNLHSVHHLFPRVPFYRYHALHRRIEPAMRAHGTPMIGIFSRQPEG